MQEKTPIIRIENVCQDFRQGFWLKKVRVLSDIGFSIPKGSVFGILGPNGAGKTTVIQLIVGLRAPTLGKVLIDDRPTTLAESHAKIGYMPERPYFHEHLTGMQLLNYMGTLCGMSKKDIASRAPVVLKLVGMEHAAQRELRKYSKGMLQRIGLAQAILHDPDVLVFDEPMSGLDPLGRKEMRDLIKRLGDEGKTVIFSSHIIQDVEATCDQVAIIKKGRLVGSGWIGQFLEKGPLRTEVAFSGTDQQSARKILGDALLETIPEGFKATLGGQDEVGLVLSKLLENRAKVLWVNPLRPSLEDLLMVKDQST